VFAVAYAHRNPFFVVLMTGSVLSGCMAYVPPPADPPVVPIAQAGRAALPGVTGFLIRATGKAHLVGDDETAIALYARAASLDPRNVAAFIGEGRLHAQRGDPGNAAARFRGALELDAGNIDALRGLGDALIAQGQPEAAIGPLEAAVASSGNVASHAQLGLALISPLTMTRPRRNTAPGSPSTRTTRSSITIWRSRSLSPGRSRKHARPSP